MKLSVGSINNRLEFLYDKLNEVEDEFPVQRNIILSEIDKNRGILLELEIEQ